jgi:hypothetical protein
MDQGVPPNPDDSTSGDGNVGGSHPDDSE